LYCVVYVDNYEFSLCIPGVGGAFASCTPQSSTVLGSAISYYASGGFAVNNGFAYITDLSTVASGIEICSVGSDGTLSNWADSGVSFVNPKGIAIH
jgi:hypothetical protein